MKFDLTNDKTLSTYSIEIEIQYEFYLLIHLMARRLRPNPLRQSYSKILLLSLSSSRIQDYTNFFRLQIDMALEHLCS